MSVFLLVCWDILVDSSVWMLMGFFMAGLLRSFVPPDIVARHLGKGRSGNVFKAALFGIPLPLCSCGVIPAAAGLRRLGASRGATASFLISTPETGVDSMAVTWALLDPLMTVLRPLSAFVTAMVTGLVVDAADKGGEDPAEADGTDVSASLRPCSSASCSCSGSDAAPASPEGFQIPSLGKETASGMEAPAETASVSGQSQTGQVASAPDSSARAVPVRAGSAREGLRAMASTEAGKMPFPTAEVHVSGDSRDADQTRKPSMWKRFLAGQRFAFGDLMGDIAPWFGLGILLAGFITLYLPEDLGAMLPGGGAMLAMLLISLPMYVCATASTPIAAALALKGFSPGSLLVFLLAGPATNAATIVMVGRLLGKRSAVIYVASIVVVTLACAVAADALYVGLGFEVHAWIGHAGAEEGGVAATLAALAMLAVLVRASAQPVLRKLGLLRG